MFKNKAEIATLATFLSLLSFVLFDVIGQNAVNPEQFLAAFNLYQNIVDSIKNLNPSLAPYITAQMVPARTDCTFADGDIEVLPHPVYPDYKIYKVSDSKDKVGSVWQFMMAYRTSIPIWFDYQRWARVLSTRRGGFIYLQAFKDTGQVELRGALSRFGKDITGKSHGIITYMNSCGVFDTVFVSFEEKPDVIFRLRMDRNFEQVWPKTSQPVIYRLTSNGTLEQIQGPSQQ
jgi:hypothetical protein